MRRLACLLTLLLASLPAAAMHVVASIHPLALIASAVVGADQVQQLVPPGASSHDYNLRPSDRINLANAQIVLWVGPVHEGFLVKVLNGSPARQVVCQRLPGITVLPQRDLDDHQPQRGTTDAHLWLSPANAVVIARALAQAAGDIQPGEAARYHANADAFAADLLAAQGRLHAQLADVAARPYLAWHDAYQYLDTPLGLHFAGAVTTGHEQPPGVRHLAQVAAEVREQHLGCLLAEPGFDPALADRIFNGAAARVTPVDELFTSAAGYRQGLEAMADAIRTCLGG